MNVPSASTGVNLEAMGAVGSSHNYKIKVKNETANSVAITLGYQVGLDYNDLTLPSDGHLFEELVERKFIVVDLIVINITG